jgi:hypothetical protein
MANRTDGSRDPQVSNVGAGWHRQGLALDDGGFAVRKTIVKAKGLGDATQSLNT